MNSQVAEKIIEQLSGIIETNNFKAVGENIEYKNDRLAFKVDHDEEKKMLVLQVAEVNEAGETNEYNVASSWLFEESENLRDAESAGLDFVDTLKGKLGIRRVRTNRSGEVVMPRKEVGGTPNIESLCVKTLAIFPQFKETYKEHVSHYGSLLAIEFFKTTLTVKLAELLKEDNKKALKKTFAMLSDMYAEGDRNVQNIVVGVVLGGAVLDNKEFYDRAIEYIGDNNHFKNAFVAMMNRVNNDKRFKEILAD